MFGCASGEPLESCCLIAGAGFAFAGGLLSARGILICRLGRRVRWFSPAFRRARSSRQDFRFGSRRLESIDRLGFDSVLSSLFGLPSRWPSSLCLASDCFPSAEADSPADSFWRILALFAALVGQLAFAFQELLDAVERFAVVVAFGRDGGLVAGLRLAVLTGICVRRSAIPCWSPDCLLFLAWCAVLAGLAVGLLARIVLRAAVVGFPVRCSGLAGCCRRWSV